MQESSGTSKLQAARGALVRGLLRVETDAEERVRKEEERRCATL